jgi:hypothetical protein
MGLVVGMYSLFSHFGVGYDGCSIRRAYVYRMGIVWIGGFCLDCGHTPKAQTINFTFSHTDEYFFFFIFLKNLDFI